MFQLRQRHAIAWLALVALAMQFALSLGHVHDIFAARGGQTTIFASSSCDTGKVLSCDPGLPAHDDNSCFVCWLLSFAGSTVPPALVVLFVPSLLAGLWYRSRAATLQNRAKASPFRARAPPITCCV